MLTTFLPLAMLPLVPALLACAVAARLAPARAAVATLVVTAIGALLAAGFVIGGSVPGDLMLLGRSFGLDALSGFFLLPVLLAGLATALFGIGQDRPGTKGWEGGVRLPLLLAGLALTLLAGDGFVLLLGLGLVAVAEWEPGGRVVAPLLGLACLVGVVGLLAPVTGDVADPRFFATYAVVPGRLVPVGLVLGVWRGGAALVLLLLGTGLRLPAAGRDLGGRHRGGRDAGGPDAGLARAMAPVISLYVLARVLFDLAGPLPPAWWGWVLLATGAAIGVAGGARALAEAELRGVIEAAGLAPFGVGVAALGLAVIAHAADLPPLASLALGAALLQAVVLALAQTLLLLGATAVAEGAGTRRLDRLGGLVQSMRSTSACVVVGAAAFAALPPAAGFAAAWLAFQALFASLRIGGMPLLLHLAIAAAGLALGLGLALAAMLRVLGVAFLGRPRSPRGAAADEAPRPAILAMAGLAGALLVLGLLPGPVLTLAAPALHALVGAQPDGRNSALVLVPQEGQMPYSAVAVTGLLVVLVVLTRWAGRRWTVGSERRGPAWEDGFAAPPAWLPFGDPLTEISPDGFAAPLQPPGRQTGAQPRRWPAMPALIGGWARRAAERITDLDPAPNAALALALLAALLLLGWAAGA